MKFLAHNLYFVSTVSSVPNNFLFIQGHVKDKYSGIYWHIN